MTSITSVVIVHTWSLALQFMSASMSMSSSIVSSPSWITFCCLHRSWRWLKISGKPMDRHDTLKVPARRCENEKRGIIYLSINMSDVGLKRLRTSRPARDRFPPWALAMSVGLDRPAIQVFSPCNTMGRHCVALEIDWIPRNRKWERPFSLDRQPSRGVIGW